MNIFAREYVYWEKSKAVTHFIYFYNNNEAKQSKLLHETVEISIQMYRNRERGFCLIAFI